jgi:hypothetical protein
MDTLAGVQPIPSQINLNLDNAWQTSAESLLVEGKSAITIPTVNLPAWGPKLRFHGKRREVDSFYSEVEARLTPFVLYGSGDFHHLAGVLLRRIKLPVTVISFDNHPDWDVRPPYWACGGWVNRALELPQVKRVSVWGCGNFELTFPSRMYANHKALKSGRLEIHAWAERQSPGVQKRFNCMSRENWRERFEPFAESVAGQDVYVTVDLDCLREGEAITNWENGLFTADDVAWAIGRLRERARIAGGDLCGAWSHPTYARVLQRLGAQLDHPRLPAVDRAEARRVNDNALGTIWPVLVGDG